MMPSDIRLVIMPLVFFAVVSAVLAVMTLIGLVKIRIEDLPSFQKLARQDDKYFTHAGRDLARKSTSAMSKLLFLFLLAGGLGIIASSSYYTGPSVIG